MHPSVHSSSIYNTKTWKQAKQLLADEWIKKMWYIYTVEYYSAIRDNKTMPFAATRKDLKIIKLRQKEKEKYHMISLVLLFSH